MQFGLFTPTKRWRVISYGGGLDSYVMLLEAIRLQVAIDAVVFVDVSDPNHEDPGEWPGTYQHMQEVVRPLCAEHSIPFIVLDSERYPIRDSRSLFAWMWKRGQIPVAGDDRLCTIIAKVERFEAWMDFTYPDQEVEVWVGFEAGEDRRAEKDPNAGKRRRVRPGQAVRVNRFPLIEWGLCRCQCESLCRSRGLQIPRKSACVFCPYGTKQDWQEFERSLPEQFGRVEQLEERKPPTSKGFKLSIMGFRKLKDEHGNVLSYKAPKIRDWIKGVYKPRLDGCPVCGAAVKATKATGCGYLP